MHNIKNTLVFTGEKDAHLFFYSSGKNGLIRIDASCPTDILFTDSSGNILKNSTCWETTDAGIFRAVLRKDTLGRRTVDLFVSQEITPFLMPSTGVVWKHGEIFPLLLDKNSPHALYALSDPAFDYKVVVMKGTGYGEKVRIVADHKPLATEWYPKLNREWFWYSAELNSNAKYIEFHLNGGIQDIRFTLWNSPLIALVKPEHEIPMGKITLSVFDEAGQRTDARYELFAENERVLMYDVMRDETPSVAVPVGKYTLKISHGIRYHEIIKTVEIRKDETFAETYIWETAVNIPKGWAFGELHNHSAFEDATAFPAQNARAARAEGKNFLFMTDKDVHKLLQYGPHNWDVSGEFIGIPGQEIMCQELHMNVLNTDRQFFNPEADNMDKPNNDIEQKIAAWIHEYKEMKQVRPCLIMHNHPSHNMNAMTNGRGYFRSWWVSDLFKEFTLVENCDYQGWFDRLNRGRKLFAAWTGDSHDCSLMYPGKEGVCVYVGNELNEARIISALEQGHFFCTRAPGVFMEISIGGAKMGDVYNGVQPQSVKIKVSASHPIERVELVANGTVRSMIEPQGVRSGEYEFELPEDAMWVIGRVKCTGSEWDKSAHSFTPFMVAGYDGFTNPIFITEKYMKN